MLNFYASPRTGDEKTGCHVCCCEQFSVIPGETNKVIINYAYWSVPIAPKGLSCGTQIDISPCLNCSDNGAFKAGNIFGRTFIDEQYDGQFASALINPDDLDVKYSVLPFFQPKNGTLVIDAVTGDFQYTPYSAFIGIDSFYYKADAGDISSIAQVIISTDRAIVDQNKQPGFDPAIQVKQSLVSVNRALHVLSFPITASPAAKTGDIYKMTIRQSAIDCDCNEFFHESCYDITVSKC